METRTRKTCACRAWRKRRRVDWALGLLLIAAALLCHGRYLLDPSLLFATEGDSFREILPTSILLQRSLLNGDPFWSWSFGLGGDIFTELSYAGTTSVFTYIQYLLRLLTGSTALDIHTALGWKLGMSVSKLALAMLLTYALLRSEHIRPAYAAVGALCYGCAPWFLYRAIVFDFMTDAYVWLPLTMLCYSRYRKTGRWIPLSLSIALLIGSNLYFGYIGCIFFASVFLLFEADGTRGYAPRILKLLGVAVVGALLSCVALLPGVNGILSSDRTVGQTALRFLPRWSAIKTLFPALFMGSGMLALPVAGLSALFLKRKLVGGETRRRTWLALLWLILYLIPATSSVMNGFSYETPRWQFVLIFAVAIALPYWLDALEWQGDAIYKPARVIALCAALLLLYMAYCDKTVSVASMAWAASFALSVCCIPWILFRTRLERARLFTRVWSAVLVALFLAAGVLNAVSVRVHNLYRDDAETLLLGSEAQQAANFDLAERDGAFYRVHDLEIDVHDEDMENRPYVYGTYGISNYASELSGRLSYWHKKVFRFRTTPVCAGIYQSFDDRLFPEIAWALRYKAPAAGAADDLPEAWVLTKTKSGAPVYENQYNTGFDLWYDTAVGMDVWDAASPAMRDALLLQTAYVDDETAARYPAPSLDPATTTLALSLADASVEGGEWAEDGRLLVADKATLTWAVSAPASAGEWLVCVNLAETSGESSFTLTAGGRAMDKFADSPASESLNYPLFDYALRFAGEETKLAVTLTRGVYALSDFSVSFNDYAYLSDWVDARNQYNFSSLCVEGSRVDGVITVGESGILALSMPYEKGWRCRVDGESAALLCVNGLFAGVELSPGTHSIQLRYVPPYLIFGACVTLCVALALAVCAILHKRKTAVEESHVYSRL